MASSSSLPLYAAIDMGTSSFKLLIAQAHPNGGFVPLLRHNDPVVLGRGGDAAFSVSEHAQSRAIESLKKFQAVLRAQNVDASRTRCVATSAVREAANRREFVRRVRDQTGLEVEVLPGEEEARLVYLSAVQFFPIFERLALCVDIGGGSTEFVVGQRGNVLFAESLKLGHVSLTERFSNMDDTEVQAMRAYIRSVVQESGLAESVKRLGFDVVVGSSGTARALENAAFTGGAGYSDWTKREWKLSRGQLRGVVKSLLREGDEKLGLFGRRSEFIVAGAVLLEEIFEALAVEEMEISGFALAEGVVGEILSRAGPGSRPNSRWGSVVRTASRFCGKKKMADAAQCARIAKEIFEALRKCSEFGVFLDDNALEYLEAACLLHSIGLSGGKRGYHKQSYHLIMNGDHLLGYRPEEIKVIALLAKHHRKKLPKLDQSLHKESPKEVKQFMFLCAILRVSVALWKHKSMDLQETDSSLSHKGFDIKSVLRDLEGQNSSQSSVLIEAENSGKELRRELEYFKSVFHQDLSLIVSSRALIQGCQIDLKSTDYSIRDGVNPWFILYMISSDDD